MAAIIFFIPDVIFGTKTRVVIPDATAGTTGLSPPQQTSGKFAYKHLVGVAVGTTYNATADDCIIGCDTTAGPITVNLPAGMDPGKLFGFPDEGGHASSNNITVNVPPGGQGSMVFATDHGSALLYCAGSNSYGILSTYKI